MYRYCIIEVYPPRMLNLRWFCQAIIFVIMTWRSLPSNRATWGIFLLRYFHYAKPKTCTPPPKKENSHRPKLPCDVTDRQEVKLLNKNKISTDVCVLSLRSVHRAYVTFSHDFRSPFRKTKTHISLIGNTNAIYNAEQRMITASLIQ